jgi:site-specific DNA recombinase
MTRTKPRNAILYARISDARGDGRSVADQERDMRAYADRLGWSIGHVLREPDTSAFKRRKVMLPDGSRALRVVRPEFRRALDALATGQADALLAYDLDRACRDPRDLEDLIDVVEEQTIPVESVTGSLKLATDADVTMARVMVAVANKASRDTSRRVKRAAQTRAEQGGNHGGRRAFGYEPDGVTLKPEEAAEIRKAADALLAGRSLRSVVAGLRARDVATVTGCPWTPTAFRDVMLRPRNAGIATYKGEPVGRGRWEPLYDEETHRRLVALLTDPARRTSPGNVVRWLGSGLYRCGICGAQDLDVTMRATRSGGGVKFGYRCSESGHLTREAEPVDRLVVGALLNRLDDADALAGLRHRPSDTGPDPDVVAREIVKLETRLASLKGALRDPDAEDVEDIRRAMADLRDRIAEAEGRLVTSTRPDPLADIAGKADVVEVWAGLDLERQRQILDLLAIVTIRPTRRGRRPGATRRADGSFGTYFDPDTVDIDWK